MWHIQDGGSNVTNEIYAVFDEIWKQTEIVKR
jgi:hypothetical protein